MTEGTEARLFLRRHHAGVLSTLSKRLGGYPFGSITPFVLDAAARPVILVSRLAEHTKNMEADPRVSLFVHEDAKDVQTAARLTLVADAERVGNVETVRARYLRYFPDGERLLSLGDFSFFALAPVFIRHIGGFGAIRSISPQSYAPPESRLAEAEGEIVAHMNADHAPALGRYCAHAYGVAPEAPHMIGIDCDGFDVRAGDRVLRFEFDEPVTDPGKAREAFARLSERARGT
jgi:putative heme iron utilization protein